MSFLPLLVASRTISTYLEQSLSSENVSIVLDNNYKYVVSHKKIKFDDTVDTLYNPLNITFDYKVRDVRMNASLRRKAISFLKFKKKSKGI